MRLVLATRNAHKAREFAQLLDPHTVVELPPDVALPPETGTTFVENALGKARAAAAATGQPAIGDDSGIAAEALGGAPGVRSARFAGEDATDEENLARLIREAPEGSRVAYVCAIAYADGDEEWVVEGRCEGTLTHAPRGTNGFGYDPAFVPDEQPGGEAARAEAAGGRGGTAGGSAGAAGGGSGAGARTMAELSPQEKDAISHRGHAARALLERLG